jgi:hypothetical protein
MTPLVVTIVGGAILLLLGWIGTSMSAAGRDRRDSAKIYKFLRTSSSEGKWEFRTTHAICAATKIPETRVAELCGGHPKIKRNEKDRDSWHLDP